MKRMGHVAIAAAVFSLAGCPAGKGADVVKSDKPKASKGPVEAGTDKVSCEPGKNYEALAVDWDPEMRGDLEVAMKQGTVVLEYTCDKLAVLDDCTASGEAAGYGFIGMARKEKVMQMTGADEIKANLPLQGVKWVADAKVGMERGTSLNVAMMMIGMRKSALRALGKGELEGDCDGATHYVSAATLGAFVLASGSSAKVEAAATFFGKGAEGGSSSAEEVHAKDGTLEDCMKADPAAKAPPPQCAAVIRLKMKALKDGEATAQAASGDGQEDTDVVACPGDLVWSDGACTSDTSAPHQCTMGDAVGCTAQCEAGDASSCTILGSMYWLGKGVDKDWQKSATSQELACEKGNARGCRYAGVAYRTGQGVKKDLKKSRALLIKSCEGADGLGCVELGLTQIDQKDGGEAVYSFRKACYGGEFEGCAQMGVMYWEGMGGVKKNPKLAVPFFEKGCKEGSAMACTRLADALEDGKGVAKDKARATELREKACNRGYVEACGK